MIVIDDKIRNKWHSGFTRYTKPNELVIHGTGGGNTYDWVLNGGRAKQYVKGVALFHYLIDLQGVTTEIISPDRWVYHSSSGWHDRRTIGIELINLDSNNERAYNELQYVALYDLIIELYERYPIKYITSHARNKKEYSQGIKECPGNFDWDRLEQWFVDAGFIYEKQEEQFYKLEGKSEDT
jgi:N-acetyl-anhydromuramyl-L-alanine amidase AmpD